MFTRGHLIFTYQMAGIKLKKPNSEKPCSTYALPSATLQPLRCQRARILGWQMYVSVLPSFLRRGSRWLCAPVGNPPLLRKEGLGVVDLPLFSLFSRTNGRWPKGKAISNSPELRPSTNLCPAFINHPWPLLSKEGK